MIPLFRESEFVFRFAESRCVDRFHLEGIEPGRSVRILREGSRELWATATVEAGGWVRPAEALMVGPGRGFVVALV